MERAERNLVWIESGIHVVGIVEALGGHLDAGRGLLGKGRRRGQQGDGREGGGQLEHGDSPFERVARGR